MFTARPYQSWSVSKKKLPDSWHSKNRASLLEIKEMYLWVYGQMANVMIVVFVNVKNGLDSLKGV